MRTSREDMQSWIQEWFAQSLDLQELRDTYYTVRYEIDKQFEIVAEDLIRNKDLKDSF